MRKSLLLFALMMGTVNAAVPFNPKPDPLNKVVTVPARINTFGNSMKFISDETGINIKIDVDSLSKHGITQNQRVFLHLGIANKPAIEVIGVLIGQIDNTGDTVVAIREEDGSLTITTK